MTASIMVVSYNRLDLTKKTIASLFDTTNFPFRLIVIDNNSEDKTQEFLKNYDWENTGNDTFQGVDLQFNDKNLGIAIGRNQAITIANKYQDPFLITIDNDVEFFPTWLYDMVSFIEYNPEYCIGINYEKTQYPMESIGGRKFQRKVAGNLGTATMGFSRSLHEKIGYFNMDWGLYSCEDSEWGFRARLAGYQMGYLPRMGTHLGEGENDVGEYRDFKTKAHEETAPKFRKLCGDYIGKRKDIYIGFDSAKIA